MKHPTILTFMATICFVFQLGVSSAVTSGTSGSNLIAPTSAPLSNDVLNGSSLTVSGVPTPPHPLNASSTLGTVRLSWEDTSSNEINFKIYRMALGGVTILISQQDANVGTYYDVNVPTGTYQYSISSCNTSGCSDRVNFPQAVTVLGGSNQSTDLLNSASSTVSLAPNAPTSVRVRSVISPTGSYNIISWTDNSLNETSFVVNRSNRTGFVRTLGSTLFNVTTYTDTTVVSGEAYTYTILSCNVTVCSSSLPSTTVVIGVENLVATTTATTTLVRPISKILSGNVLFSNGTPAPDAEVLAYNKNTGNWISTTTNTGAYILALGAGDWNIQARPKNTTTGTWVSKKIATVSFSNTDTSFLTPQNFTADSLNADIQVVVVDESNNPIPGVGVTVDSQSMQSAVTDTGTRNVQTLITNERGEITLSTSPGTYFIRTTVPIALRFISPDEQTLSVNASELKKVTVGLKRETVVNTRTISGITKFDDGTPTSAFVYAWSDKGDREYSSSTVNGFTLTLSADTKWYIGGTKDAGGKSYKTTEQMVDTSTTTGSIALIFERADAEVLPETARVTRDSRSEINVTVNDGAGVSLPPLSTVSSGNVSVQIKPTVEAPSYSVSQVVSTVYDITIKTSRGVPVTKLSSDAEITIPYDENVLRAQGVTPESLVPSYFDEKAGVWVSVPKFIINKEKKEVVLLVNHFTRFALIASAADVTPPEAPAQVAVDVTNPKEVLITWANPFKDFHHAKVYRSVSPGTLGDIIATEVFMNSFKDAKYSVGGRTYYYTVRSVDPAGNESGNLNQLAVTPRENSSLLTVLNKTGKYSLLLPPGQALQGEIVRVLELGSKGEDVKELQTFLRNEGSYPNGKITGYFGPVTRQAVKRFQLKYADDILAPAGFTKPTGMIGGATRKKINELIANGTVQ